MYSYLKERKLLSIGLHGHGVIAIGVSAHGIIAIGIAAHGIIAIALVPMGVVSVGVVSMGLLSAGLVSMGWITAAPTGMGPIRLLQHKGHEMHEGMEMEPQSYNLPQEEAIATISTPNSSLTKPMEMPKISVCLPLLGLLLCLVSWRSLNRIGKKL